MCPAVDVPDIQRHKLAKLRLDGVSFDAMEIESASCPSHTCVDTALLIEQSFELARLMFQYVVSKSARSRDRDTKTSRKIVRRNMIEVPTEYVDNIQTVLYIGRHFI
jgi:hypothetical protein